MKMKNEDTSGGTETVRSWFMLVVSFIMIFMHGLGLYSPPIYYVAYVEYFAVSKSTGAWVNSIYPACCFTIGLISSAFTEKYGCCITTFIGAATLFLSLVISAFSSNIVMIFIFQGALAGFGAGIMFISNNVILTKYFDKHIAFACSISINGLSVAMFVAPALVSHLIGQYGWRGSILIQAAILAHMMPLSILFKDPDPKLKPDDNFREDRKLLSSSESINQKNSDTSVWNTMFDCTMLKSLTFLVYCLSNLLTRINSNTLITHLPTLCVSQGFSLQEAARVASVSGASCMVSRLLAGVMSLYSQLDHLAVYGVVMMLNALSSILLLDISGLQGKYLGSAVFGFAFGFDYPFVPVILVQLQGVENLAKALALYNIISMAPVIAAMAPIGGWLYDKTGSYNTALYTGALSSFFGAMLSLFLAYYTRYHKK